MALILGKSGDSSTVEAAETRHSARFGLRSWPVSQDFSGPSQTLWARGGKRVFDCLVSGVLLLASMPVLFISALLIKMTSPGPLFFVQSRIGRNGLPFRLVKLRTMRADRKSDVRELVPLDHPDITSVGWFLRRFKIDELPQLVAVFWGTMSLVGPRPTLPDQVASYDDFRRRRLLVRPGLTGLAQVNGNTQMPWDERILYDLAYVRACGFRMDMSILLRTIRVILAGERPPSRSFRETPYASLVEIPPGYLAKTDQPVRHEASTEKSL